MAQTPTSKKERARRTILALALATVALLVFSTIALAQVRIGSDSDDILIGTNSGDHLTGKGGNDTLKGLAGNDVYHFADGFRHDSLEERATYKVGTKTLPGGTDTLSFTRYLTGLDVRIVPGWARLGYNRVSGDSGFDTINLGTSRVENVVGGRSNDIIHGGAGKNTYSGGPGGDDKLYDWGGWKDDGTYSAQAVSDDVYRGFASGTGHDGVYDYGGSADRMDLRPLESSEVYFDAFDKSEDGIDDSLVIMVDDQTSVTIYGQLAPIPGADYGNGRIEQIVFSDETVASTAEVESLMQVSSGEKGVRR